MATTEVVKTPKNSRMRRWGKPPHDCCHDYNLPLGTVTLCSCGRYFKCVTDHFDSAIPRRWRRTFPLPAARRRYEATLETE